MCPAVQTWRDRGDRNLLKVYRMQLAHRGKPEELMSSDRLSEILILGSCMLAIVGLLYLWLPAALGLPGPFLSNP